MSGGRTKIGRKGQQAIAALLTEPTHEMAAEKVGIGPATLQRWLRLPEFQAALKAAQCSAFDDAIARLKTATGQAVATLAAELAGVKASDRIRAALGILEHAFRARELLDHEGRIAELESILAELQADEPKSTS